MSLLLHYIVPIIHVLSCLFLIVVVLLQTGKGADMGAVFGGGSQTLFGSGGAGNFLTRLTTGDGGRVHADVADPHLRPDAVDALAPAPAPPAPSSEPAIPEAPPAPGAPAADAGAPAEAPLAAAPETGGQTEPAAPPAGQTPPAAGEAPAAKTVRLRHRQAARRSSPSRRTSAATRQR